MVQPLPTQEEHGIAEMERELANRILTYGPDHWLTNMQRHVIARGRSQGKERVTMIILLTSEERKAIFLNHFTTQYGEEAAKELLDQLPDCNYGKAIAEAQTKKIKGKLKVIESPIGSIHGWHTEGKYSVSLSMALEDWEAFEKEVERGEQ